MGPNSTIATGNVSSSQQAKVNSSQTPPIPDMERRKPQKASGLNQTPTMAHNSTKAKGKNFTLKKTATTLKSNGLNEDEQLGSSNDLCAENNTSGASSQQQQQHQQQHQNQAQQSDAAPSNFTDDQDGRELASKCLLLPQKRFYLDVKQNKRGRFIKVAEVNLKGKKSRIIFSIATAAEFCDLLLTFSNFDESQGDFPNQDERLKSERLQRDSRLYYFDLKENDRGRYLRCTQLSSHGPGPRSQITIPEPNILEFRDSLLDLVNQFGEDYVANQDQSSTSRQNDSRDLQANNSASKSPPSTSNNNNTITSLTADMENFQFPEGRVLKLDNKRYYFDVSQNHLGVYMKISEVKPTMRTTLTIPEKSWVDFRDMFNECMEKMQELKAEASS